MKKNILSKILTSGIITIPILVGISLISNYNIASNKNISLNTNRTKTIIEPLIPTDGIISKEFVTELIAYKKSVLEIGAVWDGILVADDFIGAITVQNEAFKDNSEITSISLPNTVKLIDSHAFSGASQLTTISALGVTNIGFNAFGGASMIINGGIKLTYSENIKSSNIGNWGQLALNKYIIFNTPQPIVPLDGVITSEFVTELIAYKKTISSTDNPWDGSLIANDFIGATSIGFRAFSYFYEITSITLPISVTSIGVESFRNVDKLTTISALGVTNIDSNAFEISRLIISGGIKLTYSENIKLGNAHFWGTTIDKLSIVNAPIEPIVPENITFQFVNELITYKKFMSSTINPWNGSLVESDFIGANSIDIGAFQSNSELTSIVLPTSITSIGANAFRGAVNLTTISALGATSIGDGAFSGTTNIITRGIKLSLSENVNIYKAFSWGTNIEKLDITKRIIPIISESGIITPEFVNELINYKNTASTVADPWDGSLLITYFTGATSVADNAFKNKKQLITSIKLPNTVTSIGANAFDGASCLTSISALGVTNIDADAFSRTTSITPGGIKLTYSETIKPSKSIFWGTTTDKLSIVNTPKPIEPLSGIITPEFVNELIAYKNSISTSRASWNGVLVETDFVGATTVADGAFKDKKTTTSITLPMTVTSIGADAFNGSTALTTISALGATTIGNGAFTGTTSINNGGIKLTESKNISADKFKDWGLTVDGILDIKKVDFFDNINNIYMIVTAASTALLLIGGITAGTLIYNKNAKISDSDKNKSQNLKADSKDKKNKHKSKDSKEKIVNAKNKDHKDDSKKKSIDNKDLKEKNINAKNKSIDNKDLKTKSINPKDKDDKLDLSKSTSVELKNNNGVLDSMSIQELKDKINKLKANPGNTIDERLLVFDEINKYSSLLLKKLKIEKTKKLN